jgi:hypothetical protein
MAGAFADCGPGAHSSSMIKPMRRLVIGGMNAATRKRTGAAEALGRVQKGEEGAGKLDAVPGAKDGLHLEHTTRREGWLLRPDIHTGGH